MTEHPNTMTWYRHLRDLWPSLEHRYTTAAVELIPSLDRAAEIATVRRASPTELVRDLDELVAELEALAAQRVVAAAQLLELGASVRYVAEAARMAPSAVARIARSLEARS